MMTDRPSLFAREDTMLGVCEGLGQELGVAPNLLRVAFAIGLFWNPLAMIVAYLALGTALALFRWAFPPRQAATAAVPSVQPQQGDNDDTASPTALAA